MDYSPDTFYVTTVDGGGLSASLPAGVWDLSCNSRGYAKEKIGCFRHTSINTLSFAFAFSGSYSSNSRVIWRDEMALMNQAQ